MKQFLGVAIVAAMTVTLVSLAQSASPPRDPRTYDVDGDGAVTILDIAAVADHFLEAVGTPDACAEVRYYATPINQVDAAGTVVGEYSVGIVLPAGHPFFSAPVALRPCG